jgi:copper-binding protein NosD
MNRLLLVVLFSMGPVLAQGATYFVSKTGSDSNSCEQAQSASGSKLTIKAGLACLYGGDTLIIKAGTYAESIGRMNGSIDIPNGLDDSRRTVVTGAPGETVTLKPSGSTDVVMFYRRSYISLKNLILDATNVNSQGIGYNDVTHHIRVERCVVKNAPIYCISSRDQVTPKDHLEVVANDVGPCGQTAIYFKASDILVEHNTIHGATGVDNGIRFANSTYGTPSVNNIARDNRIYGNGRGINLAVNGALAYNNIIYNNSTSTQAAGVTVTAGAANTKIYNNSIVNSNGYCIWIVAGTGHTVKNNICWQNANNSIRQDTAGNTISNNMFSNPSFVDGQGGNFALTSNSAAIDAGVTVSEVKDDFNGVQRPQASAFDIGAFEYPSAPSNLRVVGAK